MIYFNAPAHKLAIVTPYVYQLGNRREEPPTHAELILEELICQPEVIFANEVRDVTVALTDENPNSMIVLCLREDEFLE